MKYVPMFDIWTATMEFLNKVQPGQMVYARTPDNRGRFMGIKKSGVVVVAWSGNVRSREDRREYLRDLRRYTKSC